ncbi:hypothetical protein [Mycolicibacterium sediminis]|uniref:Uncharacterized protein n=1 Tax=Mycolicibacterium sediminis TaxID=1286180 RepID=A0A7I7R0A9_9MYCO|nr:hypothetical protein [Mycolicibacterium sediminis]BBY31510.1 hypothetical protein MSEDJ_56060 [Mycolicibacterium sediminis]
MSRDGFELAEAMWDAAEPCLSARQREATLTALHAGEPHEAIQIIVTALCRSRYPLPSDLHVEFTEWLRRLPGTGLSAWQLELRVTAADVQVASDVSVIDGLYGDATLCYFILDDAGVVDASHGRQADALKGWLETNRPSPSLRTDLQLNGFGYLLNGSSRSPSDGTGTQ